MSSAVARLCGQCVHYCPTSGQKYNDCREDSPKVIVASFKPGEGSLKGTEVGKIMTVWPRVAEDEIGCGKFKSKSDS